MNENLFFTACMFVGDSTRIKAHVDRDEIGRVLYTNDDHPITVSLRNGVVSGLTAYMTVEAAIRLSESLADAVREYERAAKEAV